MRSPQAFHEGSKNEIFSPLSPSKFQQFFFFISIWDFMGYPQRVSEGHHNLFQRVLAACLKESSQPVFEGRRNQFSRVPQGVSKGFRGVFQRIPAACFCRRKEFWWVPTAYFKGSSQPISRNPRNKLPGMPIAIFLGTVRTTKFRAKSPGKGALYFKGVCEWFSGLHAGSSHLEFQEAVGSRSDFPLWVLKLTRNRKCVTKEEERGQKFAKCTRKEFPGEGTWRSCWEEEGTNGS